jgi:soluble lytic murein transglycosylase-like protein
MGISHLDLVLYWNKTGSLSEPNSLPQRNPRPPLNHLHDNLARTNRRNLGRAIMESFAAMSPNCCETRLANFVVRKSLTRSSRTLQIFLMKTLHGLIGLAALPVLLFASHAEAQQRAPYERLVAVHAKANNVPEVLVHRVIVRESKYHPDLVGRGGTIGLMQIKLATARGLGYTGDAQGLRDPDTNLAYGVKYLAGAFRAAEGDHARAIRYFANGYYYVAKRQRLERRPEPVLASAPPKEAAKPAEASEPKAQETPK